VVFFSAAPSFIFVHVVNGSSVTVHVFAIAVRCSQALTLTFAVIDFGYSGLTLSLLPVLSTDEVC